MARHFLMLCAAASAMACTAGAALSPATSAAPPPPAAVVEAQPVQRRHHDRLGCEVRLTETRNGLLFEAWAFGEPGYEGAYTFVLTRADRSGSSDVRQNGDFVTDRDGAVLLGSSEVSVDRGVRFRARLTAAGVDGQACREEVRS